MNHTEFSSKGGKASAAKLTTAQRKARAIKAINTRWKKVKSLVVEIKPNPES